MNNIFLPIFIIILALSITISISNSFTDFIYTRRYEKPLQMANLVADKYFAQVENDGYMTTETKLGITEELSDEFTEVNIEGTDKKVNKDETVYLQIHVIDKHRGSFNGTSELINKTIIRDGIYTGN